MWGWSHGGSAPSPPADADAGAGSAGPGTTTAPFAARIRGSNRACGAPVGPRTKKPWSRPQSRARRFDGPKHLESFSAVQRRVHLRTPQMAGCRRPTRIIWSCRKRPGGNEYWADWRPSRGPFSYRLYLVPAVRPRRFAGIWQAPIRVRCRSWGRSEGGCKTA